MEARAQKQGSLTPLRADEHPPDPGVPRRGPSPAAREDDLQGLAAASMYLQAGLKGSEADLRAAAERTLPILKAMLRNLRSVE